MKGFMLWTDQLMKSEEKANEPPLTFSRIDKVRSRCLQHGVLTHTFKTYETGAFFCALALFLMAFLSLYEHKKIARFIEGFRLNLTRGLSLRGAVWP